MSSTAAIPTDGFTRRLQKIGQMITAGDLPKAASELNAALKQQPTDPRVFLQGARLAEASRNPKGAEELARRAVSLNPYWVVSVTELALLLARLGRAPEALEQARKAVALEPNNPDVLGRVADLAQQAGDYPLAVEWLERLCAQRPGDNALRNQLARALRAQGDNERALTVYGEMLAVNALDREALLARTQIFWAQGKLEEAAQDCEQLISREPDVPTFQFWNELAHGRTPVTMPAEIVNALFDGNAASYAQLRTQAMDYQLPTVMAELIRAKQPGNDFNLLDLGCGTGLLGLFVGKLSGAMVGVDLSLPMIEQAAKHQLYDRFHSVNLLDALAATPDALYHVIAACDAFAYVGDLSQAIPNALRVLRPDGHLVFSCETAARGEPEYLVRPSLRYAHKRTSIESLCKKAGFDKVEVANTVLFTDNGKPVKGFTVVAHKPA